jgi:hypothetical protein
MSAAATLVENFKSLLAKMISFASIETCFGGAHAMDQSLVTQRGSKAVPKPKDFTVQVRLSAVTNSAGDQTVPRTP